MSIPRPVSLHTFDGITYNAAVPGHLNAIKIFLGTNILQGISGMFAQDVKDTAFKISPILGQLLALNNGTLLSHVTIGNQPNLDEHNCAGDYITVIRADKTVAGRDIQALIHPLLLKRRDFIQKSNAGAHWVNHDAIMAYMTQQNAITAQTLQGNGPVENRLRYILDEFNKDIAVHGGRLTFHNIDGEGILHFSSKGGCTSCGSKDATINSLRTVLLHFEETKFAIKGVAEVNGQKIRFTP